MEYYVFPSRLGFIGLAARGRTVQRIVIGAESTSDACRRLECDESVSHHPGRVLRDLGTRLVELTQGRPTEFSDIHIDVSHCTDFQQRVLAACRQIAWGEQWSYGELARAAGHPRAARAVGGVMAANPYPLVVP